jgi:endo-1,3-1,4-beta-glycanase
MDHSAFDAGYTTVSNGVLRIHWKAAPITVKGATYPYTTGVATTATGFNFRYGVIEARIWLLPTPVDSTWPPEIDIAEFSTGAQGKVGAHFNVHYQKNGRLRQIAGFPTYGENLGGAWHTYTLDWRPDSMTMLLDGKAVYRYTGEGIPSTSMHIVLSNGVMKGEKPGPGSMLVDYVRVWQ